MDKKFALITGGTKGLGALLLRRFWLEGYSLGVVARNHIEIQKGLLDLPKREGQIALPLACDLSDPKQISDLIERIKIEIPRLGVLINNAAIQGPIGALPQNDPMLWQKTIQVNLLAPVALCHGLISIMDPRGGSIINLSGGGATDPRENFSAYATSKAGLVRFSETIAQELKSKNIRVNCIAPGAMKTAMLNEVLDEKLAAGEREFFSAKKVFEGGGASMDRVADLALFLAGNSSSGITGKLISAIWDRWEQWPAHLNELSSSDAYTLRRITGRDRGLTWGDK